MSGSFYSVLMGLVQGVSEFLPISSSGHLALIQIFLGVNAPQLGFDLLLHLGTLLAVVIYFAADMWTFLVQFLKGFVSQEARRSQGWRYGWAVLLGTAATAAVGIPMKPLVVIASTNSSWIGGGLVLTGTLLLISRLVRPGDRAVGLLVGLVVGIVQGLAVMPGVSRSGSTIVAALFLGLPRLEAFRFSFLLSVPAVAGATLMEMLDAGGVGPFTASLPYSWPLGFLAAALSGFLSLVVLKRVSLFGAWWFFGAYCLAVGLAVLGISFLGAF